MTMSTPPRLDATGLKQLALAPAPTAAPCPCRLRGATAWESITEERWPVALMQQVGTLRDPELSEPTFEEWHPNGTRYDSPDAPISVRHFPYNRCDVYRCTSCTRLVLRYTEFGGYYVDHRVRGVDAALIAG
ncbi:MULTISPECIES: hypothetical protein [unclassified Variovorax]|uniref:hypothetical protein n=1 Tax=unclassified Variovorax TaxID=663243 RepID=UPI003F47D782